MNEEPFPPSPAQAESEMEAPPENLARILEIAGPNRSALYALVRRIVDELEEASPWKLLYHPPDDRNELIASVLVLAEVIDVIPDRFSDLAEELKLRKAASGGLSPDELLFHFRNIHNMVALDVELVRSRAEGLTQTSEDEPSSAADYDFLAEIAADLKGKYASGIMGAASNLLARGHWPSVQVEPRLFPEKAAEYRRNEVLLQSLRETLEGLHQLPREIDFQDVLATWRESRRVDQYAFVEFSSFRGRLGGLLKESTRRALYSGDFHRIRKRERMLGSRVNEVETLHAMTWQPDFLQSRELAERTCWRLSRLILEIAAILEVDLLRDLVGEESVGALRQIVTAERTLENSSSLGGSAGVDAVRLRGQRLQDMGLSPKLETLVPLLYEEDLKTFLELLLGSVQKRGSLAPLVQAAEGPEPVEKTRPSESDVSSPVSVDLKLSQSELRAALESLRETLGGLQAPGNQRWASFRMIARLLEQRSQIPPAMLGEIHPFLQDLNEKLIPALGRVEGSGGFPPDTADSLLQHCRVILDTESPSQRQIREELGPRVLKLHRLLEAMASTATYLVEEASR